MWGHPFYQGIISVVTWVPRGHCPHIFTGLKYSGASVRGHTSFPVVQCIGLQYSVLLPPSRHAHAGRQGREARWRAQLAPGRSRSVPDRVLTCCRRWPASPSLEWASPRRTPSSGVRGLGHCGDCGYGGDGGGGGYGGYITTNGIWQWCWCRWCCLWWCWWLVADYGDGHGDGDGDGYGGVDGDGDGYGGCYGGVDDQPTDDPFLRHTVIRIGRIIVYCTNGNQKKEQLPGDNRVKRGFNWVQKLDIF